MIYCCYFGFLVFCCYCNSRVPIVPVSMQVFTVWFSYSIEVFTSYNATVKKQSSGEKRLGLGNKFKFIAFVNSKFKFIVFENLKFKFIVFENLKFNFIVFKTKNSIILKFETKCIVLKHESSYSILLCLFKLQ